MVTKVALGSVQSCAWLGYMEGWETWNQGWETPNQGCTGGLSESYGETQNEEMESDAASAALPPSSVVQWSCWQSEP